MYDVITVGSATIDVFVDTEDGLFRPCKRCKGHVNVPFGSKILIEKLKFFTGGGGTNTAVGFARLGLKTAWIGKLGDDQTGKTVLAELKKERVDTRLAAVAKGKTSGYSIILDAKGHDRTILAHKGCNDELSPSDVSLGKIKTNWIYCSSQMGRSLSTLTRIIRYSKKKGIFIAFNPSTYMITEERAAVARILKMTETLIFNKEEAGLLVGDAPIRKMIERIHKMGPKYVVVTDGKNGAWGSDGNEVWFCKAPGVPVVEATGAGDSFATGFVAGIMKGMPVDEAMKIGMVESASVIQYIGAKNILLTWKQAINKSRGLPKKICAPIR